DRGFVPLGTLVGAEPLDQDRGAVVGNLGDAPVTVLGLEASLPHQRTLAAPPAACGIERPTAARVERAADETSSGAILVCRGFSSGCASYDDSSAGASSACASRSSCASASFQTPFRSFRR